MKIFTIFWSLGARFGLIVWVMTLGSFAHGHTAHEHDKKALNIITMYKFSSASISVDTKLPLGTVIASAVIPEVTVLTRDEGPACAGLWRRKGQEQGYVMVQTNLAGLTVRLVADKAQVITLQPGQGWFYQKSNASTRGFTRGGVRIELVKTGAIQPGTFTKVLDVAEYRTYALKPVSPPYLAMVEYFKYAGHVVIEVTRPIPVKHRMS